jgi:hypothetical protein
LHRPRRPPAQVLEDASDDCRILDQRDDAHRPLALGAFQGIGLIRHSFLAFPRPDGSGLLAVVCPSPSFRLRPGSVSSQRGQGCGLISAPLSPRTVTSPAEALDFGLPGARSWCPGRVARAERLSGRKRALEF